MPRRWLFSLVLLTGCSTHPCIDVEDHFHPGKIGPNKVTPYGGVCIPQGPITGPGPSLPSVPAINVPVAVVPPPAPFPPPGAPVAPTGPPAPSIFPGR